MRRPLDPRDIPDELRRRLGLLDAVVIGLGSMIGAGIFAALAPAAYAAGSGLLLGLAVAAVVAYCNAISSARLAARYPASGAGGVCFMTVTPFVAAPLATTRARQLSARDIG